jgi:hypothetical protein
MATTKKSSPAKKTEKNSLVKNINAKKKAGTSNSKSKSTVSKKAYSDMEKNWGKD